MELPKLMDHTIDRRPGMYRVAGPMLLLALAPLVPASLAAQEITALTEDLCDTCSIEIAPDVVLGTDGESVIGIAWDIQRLADGRFVMAFQDVTYEFTVFSADGSDYRRVGREGEGPGEYAHVFFVREEGGQLQVFDRRRRRLTVLDRGFEVVRTASVGCGGCNGADVAVLPDGSVALNYFEPRGDDRDQRSNAKSGFAVHIVAEDGRLRHALDEIPIERPFVPAEDYSRWLEAAPDGSLLVAQRRRYRIDRWDPDTGELLQTFVREVDWFPEPERTDLPREPGQPPGRAILEIRQDEQERLWVHITRPTADWRDHIVRTGRDDNPERSGGFRFGPGAWETLLEVVDLKSGRILLSQVLELAGRPFLIAPGWLAVYDEESILPRYRTYRARLAGLDRR